MTYLKWKITHTPFRDGVLREDLSQDFLDIRDPLVRWKLGDSRDSFECKLLNNNNELSNTFQTYDRIIIYRAVNSDVFTENDIIFVAAVTSANQEVNSTDAYIKLVCYNFSDEIMSSVVFVGLLNKRIPAAIKESILFLQENNNNMGTFKIKWDNEQNGENPLRSDGTEFPLVLEDWQNRPFRDFMIKYSAPQFTQDGPYTWYVSIKNTLVWKRSGNFLAVPFNLQTSPIYSVKTNLDRGGIVNYVIVKAGLDPAGNQIQITRTNMPSISRYGQKFQILIGEASNAKVFNKLDLVKSYGEQYDDTSYPDLSSGFTTAWVSQVSGTVVVRNVTMTEGQPVTIPNEGSERERKLRYVAVVRAQAEAVARREADDFMNYRAFGKQGFEFSVEPGSLPWSLGTRVNEIIPYLPQVTALELRVQEIQYGADSDTFVVAEEIGTL
jgi:hypothetical protein